jgi:5-methylcytosine-specific restriction endonuclease McrA
MIMSASTALNPSLKALVLNASYEPLRIISWQKAITLWFQEKVDILEFHSAFARSASNSFKLPSVLKLKTYVRPKKLDGVRFCRENIYIRDHYTCQYCRKKFAHKELTLDHVLPASQGGPKTWTNVVTACRPCNQTKANRTPEKAKMPLLKQPKAPNWLPVVEFSLNVENSEKSKSTTPSVWKDYLRFKSN